MASPTLVIFDFSNFAKWVMRTDPLCSRRAAAELLDSDDLQRAGQAAKPAPAFRGLQRIHH